MIPVYILFIKKKNNLSRNDINNYKGNRLTDEVKPRHEGNHQTCSWPDWPIARGKTPYLVRRATTVLYRSLASASDIHL